ncbi:MAG: type II toxin-antitoxin system VapC family toxin [Ornithinimicrobium sp.]
MRSGLLDTSVWVALEAGRELALDLLPEEVFVSVVTLAELQSGVLVASDVETRSQRIATVSRLASIEALPIDATVASEWATLRAQLHQAGRRVNVNDVWIAATAVTHGMPVVTQDADFDVLATIGAVKVPRV